MKKALSFLFGIIITLAVIFAFTACGENIEIPNTPESPEHKHTAGEAVIENEKEATCVKEGSFDEVVYCTECEAEISRNTETIEKEEHTPVIDPRVEPTVDSLGKTEGSHCSECEKVLVPQYDIPKLDALIPASNQLTLNESNLFGSFANSVTSFNFVNDITVPSGVSWFVSSDIHGMSIIPTKIAPLAEGDNTFYLILTRGNTEIETYTVNIYRNRMLTATFKTNGGTFVESQTVEEGNLIAEPTTSRAGYTFDSWDYDFANPITRNITINASWIANTNTPYTVEYYLENIDKNGYDKVETVNLAGITDTTATAEQKVFEHFTFNSAKSIMSGNVNGNGSLVLKVYYTRNTYAITVSQNENYAGTVTNGGTYGYGKEITIKAKVNPGYTFLGWFDVENKVCDSASYTFTVTGDKNFEVRSTIAPEMEIFYFNSTETTCEITGIKDKTVTEIIIPDYVTTIGYEAFYDCYSLTSVTIGNSVTSIGNYAFNDCTSLTDVYYTGSESEWRNISIGSDNELLTHQNIHYNYNPEE